MHSVSEVMESGNVAVIGASRDPLKPGVLHMVGIDELIGTLISRDGRSGLCQHVAIRQKGKEGKMKVLYGAGPSIHHYCLSGNKTRGFGAKE